MMNSPNMTILNIKELVQPSVLKRNGDSKKDVLLFYYENRNQKKYMKFGHTEGITHHK